MQVYLHESTQDEVSKLITTKTISLPLQQELFLSEIENNVQEILVSVESVPSAGCMTKL